MRWLRNGWTRDLRHAVRTLRRSPGYALVAVGTLGLALVSGTWSQRRSGMRRCGGLRRGKEVRKVVYVPNRLLNLVIG